MLWRSGCWGSGPWLACPGSCSVGQQLPRRLGAACFGQRRTGQGSDWNSGLRCRHLWNTAWHWAASACLSDGAEERLGVSSMLSAGACIPASKTVGVQGRWWRGDARQALHSSSSYTAFTPSPRGEGQQPGAAPRGALVLAWRRLSRCTTRGCWWEVPREARTERGMGRRRHSILLSAALGSPALAVCDITSQSAWNFSPRCCIPLGSPFWL